ncbi:MAG: M20 family metallopeptidase [Nocardioidaceae bacterium]
MSTGTETVRRPYPTFLPTVLAETQTRADAEETVISTHRGAPGALGDGIERAVRGLTDEIVGLSHEVFDHPELCFEEHRAAAAVASLVERHGVEIEVGAYGLPTAFRATVGHGRPTVAILAEYDALPGIGHGCGHNVICASGVGAFLALAAVADDLPGAVQLIGTPAEEGGSGKELIARAGGFDDVDAALMMHPGVYDVGTYPRLGMRTVNVTYHGLEAHAAAMPFLGRNALDALVAAYNGIAQLRQHMIPSDRVHGVITDGGERPNIVPARASGTFYVRSMRAATMRELSERVEQIFRAAAQMTATAVTIEWDPYPEELPVRTNQALMERFAVHMTRRDRRMLRRSVSELSLNGSTDFGNVSVRVPGIHPIVAIAPPGVAGHTLEFAEHARGSGGDRACLDAAFALAGTAADMLCDQELRAAAEDGFAAAAAAEVAL